MFVHSLRSFLPCVSFISKPKGPSARYFRFVQRTRYLESGKNLDEIFFWAEAVILSQLARDCSAWSYSLDEIAVNANESFREWAFVLFLPRTSNNLSQTRRPACQECHKSSRKLGRQDKWFLDFDCKTLIFDLRLWLWDFDCKTLIFDLRLWLWDFDCETLIVGTLTRQHLHRSEWWLGARGDDGQFRWMMSQRKEMLIPQTSIAAFCRHFWRRPTIVLMYQQRWCLYRFKMWNKEQYEDMWPSSSTLWIDLMKEKVRRQCLSELMTQRVCKIIRTSLFPQCMIDICWARGGNAPK